MKTKKKSAREGCSRPSHDPRNHRTSLSAKDSRPKEEVETPEGRTKVTRIMDTIDVMHRRRQIDQRQYWAAGVYQRAFDKVQGGGVASGLSHALTGGVSSGGGSRAPGQGLIEAAARLAEAARILGLIDGKVIALVVGQGYSVEGAAAMMGGSAKGQPSVRDVEMVGRRLRDGLAALADAWGFPKDKGRGKVSVIRAPVDHDQVEAYLAEIQKNGVREIEPSMAAHASPEGVRWSGNRPK